jgi:dTDP-4-amino-4,6-dideoxygalactose transaminase
MRHLMKPMRCDKPIYVTRPTMPSFDEYMALIEQLWETRWLSNDGVLYRDLEERVAGYLGVEHLSLFCNGTLALLLALQMLRISGGEVITTPFTFPATPHVLHWNGITPVFCDIEADRANIDPARIEELITPATRAILGVHVYGHPCDVDAIETIANRHGLLVIYDAAHTFGSRFRNRAMASFGDAAILSFHATKLFTTAEGGALVMKTKAQRERVRSLKNFGIAGEESVIGPGINAKMSEFQAAFGLLQLEQIDNEIAQRAEVDAVYRTMLRDLPGISMFSLPAETTPNHAYFPILVDGDLCGVSRDELYDALKEYNIFTRKYFFPLCSHYPCYAGLASASPARLPVAERISKQVLCLPIYGTLEVATARQIASTIRYIVNAGKGDTG